MTINELKNILTNIGLNVESEKLSKAEVQLFPIEQPLKDNTVLEGYSCNIKNWPKFKIWINKLLNTSMALKNQHRARNYQQKQAKSQHLRHKVWLSIKKQSNTCTA